MSDYGDFCREMREARKEHIRKNGYSERSQYYMNLAAENRLAKYKIRKEWKVDKNEAEKFAKKILGLGARSGLFFEAVRIIRELKPKYFIFENVKGLLTNNGGADFVRCSREIADIGLYECEWQLVNTSWVLPQNRERVYFVGRLGGQSGAKIFPLFSGGGTYVIESQQFHKVRQINRTEKNHQQDRVYSPEGISPALNTVGGGNLEPKIVCPVLTPDRIIKRQNGRRMKENGEPSFTLTAQDKHGISDGKSVRKLTPLECERLQGFPDGWTEYGTDGRKMSDSARYKALGNAVTVNFPRMIGEKIKPVDKIKKYSNN